MRKIFDVAALVSLATFPVAGQVVGSPYVVTAPNPVTLPAIHFALQADPPSAMQRYRPGSSMHIASGAGGSEVFAHRYFYNQGDQTFFGYDVRLEFDPQHAQGSWRATFFDLSFGVLDAIPYAQRGDPAAWKKLAVSQLPSARMVKAGDTIQIEVWSDPAAGQKLTDIVHIELMPSALSTTWTSQITSFNSIRAGIPAPNLTSAYYARSIPTVAGDARAYSIDDAEMHLSQARVTLNGELQPPSGRPANAAGALVWFYCPGHGRYVLSLAPRPELGFVKSGEVRGGAMTFSDGKDKFLLESPGAIAGQNAAYFLYVLHDPDWEPTARDQANRLQFGSVAPRELELLQKK
ncbi:MAG TPA: hypothetical protein VML19_25740 [Verrucomicrobiae bacterium]|nr:hypothetical protein [Verrucomicrobiae bacterium]